MSYFQLKRTQSQQFMFNLIAGNGEIVLTSESYLAKTGALGGIASVKVNATIDARYDRRASGTQYYFVLRGANHEAIGTSERYSTHQSREAGIAAVGSEAPDAPIRDLT